MGATISGQLGLEPATGSNPRQARTRDRLEPATGSNPRNHLALEDDLGRLDLLRRDLKQRIGERVERLEPVRLGRLDQHRLVREQQTAIRTSAYRLPAVNEAASPDPPIANVPLRTGGRGVARDVV